MHVLVTGATGFVGSHTVAALQAAGHLVRVFVRDKGRVASALGPVGARPDQVEVAEGDLTRPATVTAALEGVEAVVHAASVYSYDPRDAARIGEVNLEGTRVVLGGALRAGLDPIVHVSSVVALLPTSAAVLTADLPPSTVDPRVAPYIASKAAQERHARALQADGAPVVTVLPGSVWGPDDPHEGESTRLARSIVRHQLLVSVRGGITIVDVRDVAAVLRAVVDAGPGRPPRRYLAGGAWQTLSELHRAIGAELGRRLPTVASPPWAAMMLARSAARLQQRVTPRLPIAPEPVIAATAFRPADDSRTVHELGVTFRPLRETLHDQLVWQREAGRL